MADILTASVDELEAFVEPLLLAARSGNISFVLELLDAQADDASGFSTAVGNVSLLADAARRWIEEPPQSPAEVLELCNDVREVIRAVRDLSDLLEPLEDGVDAEAMAASFVSRLTYLWLVRRWPVALGVLEATGCVRRAVFVNGSRYQVPTLNIAAFSALLGDPRTALMNVFDHNGWSDEAAMRSALKQAVARLLPVAAALGCVIVPPSRDSEDGAGVLLVRRFNLADGTDAQAALFVIPVYNDQGDLIEGWGLAPRGELNLAIPVGDWTVQLAVDAELKAVVVGSNIAPQTEPAGLAASGSLGLVRGGSEPAILVGRAAGSHLVIGTVAVKVEGSILDGGAWGLSAGVELGQCELAVRTENANSFLAPILDADLVAAFELAFGWSSVGGFYLRGSGSLILEIPIHRNVGPVRLEMIRLELTPDGSAFAAKGTLSAGLTLGPVQCAVRGIGLELGFGLADGSGNLGMLNVEDAAPLWPTGVGLALDAPGVTGGGYLEYAPDDGSYAGVLTLGCEAFRLDAVALISTQMPDGTDGFALLVVLGVQFNPPIQLSFGFTLSGVGGLLAVHRTIDVEALRSGMKQHTLDSILFPEDPILNASKIISDLAGTFPIEHGRYVFGPQVKLGWGTPNLIQADIGVFIELPEPVRVLLLGEISAALPKPDDPIVAIHIDVVGIIEFAKKTVAIDAVIYDSRILTYALHGDAALRMKWGDEPTFALSLGGWHPRFAPPAGFPALERLTLDLSSGDAVRLSCRIYHGLTSNTLQLGARIDGHAESGKATLDGDLGFDAIVYFSPFSFEVDMFGGMVARYRGHKLAGVRLALTLSGPTPWRAKGKAKFEILAWDVTVDFNESWGRTSQGKLPAVSALALLQETLTLGQSWGAALPSASGMVESLCEVEAAPDTILVHPSGTLELRQRAVPLGLTLDKVANAPITGPRNLRISRITIGNGEDLELVQLREYFPRGQFLDLSAAEKLSLPAFEKLVGGVSGSAAAVLVSVGMVEWNVVYESIVHDGPTGPSPAHPKVEWATLRGLVRRAAARATRSGGPGRYLQRGLSPVVSCGQPRFYVVESADLTLKPDDEIEGNSLGTTRVEADQALGGWTAADASRAGTAMVVEAAEALIDPIEDAAATDASSSVDERPLASYRFYPFLRRGLAAAVDATGADGRGQITATAYIEADGQEQPEGIPRQIHLFGPGDVLGFDARIVSRTDPAPNAGDFEDTMFPAIEFSEADFPWRFSPTVPDGVSLQPWIALIILEASEFTFGTPATDGAPDKTTAGRNRPRSIALNGGTRLPNMEFIARWAHVQVAGQEGGDDGAGVAHQEPERFVSRLICARRLKYGVRYHAFVVPTFKLGLVAAEVCALAEGDTGSTPAWVGSGPPSALPFYFHWEFGTAQGDFESLVRLLQPRTLTQLGVEPMDCGAPGYGIRGVSRTEDGGTDRILQSEGALRSLDTVYDVWGYARDAVSAPSEAAGFQVDLAGLLTKRDADLATVTDTSSARPLPVPVVVPPLYGAWYRGQRTVAAPPTSTSWFDEINLDPRHRAAAGYGALVIETQQEPLMAALWDQLGDVDEANQVLRHAQLGRAAASQLLFRLRTMERSDFLRVTAPVHSHVPLQGNDGSPSTVAARLRDTAVPMACWDPALRRLLRPRGPIGRRRDQDGLAAQDDMLERLYASDGPLVAAGLPRRPAGPLSPCHVTTRLVETLPASGTGGTAGGSGGTSPSSVAGPDGAIGGGGDVPASERRFCEDQITCALLRMAEEGLPAAIQGVAVRPLFEAICDALTTFLKPDRAEDPEPAPAGLLNDVWAALDAELEPTKTVSARVSSRIRLNLSEDHLARREQADPLGPIRVSPDFPQPMYEPLRDLSQSLILPGVETVPQNTLGLLQTNGRFVEAYMCGLNHCMTAEALWRGAQVGGRETYFRQFWDIDDVVAALAPVDASEAVERSIREEYKDILPIEQWSNRRLGNNDARPDSAAADATSQSDAMVLLIRGDLLKRYPGTRIFAIRAVGRGETRVPALAEFEADYFDAGEDIAQPVTPIFSGTLAPDLTFLGFPLTVKDVVGSPESDKYPKGVFFVLEQPITEPRFGLDQAESEEPADAELATWDDLRWDHFSPDGGDAPSTIVARGDYLDEVAPGPLSSTISSAPPTWSDNADAAVIAGLTLQKPVRVAVYGRRMIPKEVLDGVDTDPPT